MPFAHRAADRFNQQRIAREIGRALRQVNGVVLCGELANHAENSGADVG